jgi:hypothetical protein
MRVRSYDRKRPDIAFALANGWEYVRTSGSGHLIFRHPQVQQTCTLSCSLGGGRGERNAIAWLKRNTPREAATA